MVSSECATSISKLVCHTVYKPCDTGAALSALRGALGSSWSGVAAERDGKLGLPRFPSRSICQSVGSTCRGLGSVLLGRRGAQTGLYGNLTADGNLVSLLLKGMLPSIDR
jgi:hypothetical protein